MAGPRLYNRKVEVWPNFEGGELGRRDITEPRRAGQFTASNMMVNFRGHLMVRPGLNNRTPAGTVNGKVAGFGLTPVPTKDAFYVQGVNIRTFNKLSANNLQTAVFTLTGAPTVAVDWTVNGTQVYFVAQGSGNGVLQLNPIPTPPTVVNLTGSPSGGSITTYNDRLVVGNINTPDNQIQWNGLTAGVSDFNSWPAANFAFIGDPWLISALDWQRNHLLIAKQNSWYILTGQFGANGDLSNLAVRKVLTAQGPLAPQVCALDNEDLAWFQGIFDIYPSSTNGTYIRRYRDNTYTTDVGGTGAETIPPPMGVAPLGSTDQGAVFCSPHGVALYRNGVWTHHSFPGGQFAAGGLIASESGPNGGGNTLFLCDGGGVATPPKFYAWEMGADTPGIEGGPGFQRAGDDSATAVVGSAILPEWWSRDLGEVQVRSIIVDFSAYNQNNAGNATFDLTLNVLRRYQSGDNLSSTQSFSSAGTNFSSTGTRQRQIFGFNDAGLGNGFSMQLSNCRGIEIERIEVVLEDHPVRMGT